MRYKIYWEVTALALMLAVSSCDGLLDKEPISEISEGMVGDNGNASDTIRFKTAAQAESFLGTCYNEFQTEYFQLDYYINSEMQSDNSYQGANGVELEQIENYQLSPTNKNITRDWGYLYRFIGNANVVIDNVLKTPDQTFPDARKRQIRAEALVMRAWCYFDLVRLYGGVPLVLKAIPSINSGNVENVYPLLYPDRATEDQVYAQIEKDLIESLPLVQEFPATKAVVSKALVNSLLAKFYATKQPADWAKVKQYAQNVVGDTRYELLPDYADLFKATAQTNSKESIFEVQYNLGSNEFWGYDMHMGTDWKKFNTPTNDLVKAFDNENDQIRKGVSIAFADVSGKWTDKNWAVTAYPFAGKYKSRGAKVMLVRLADIMLLLGEAENELGGTTTAQGWLNKVRKRVSLPETSAATKDELRLAFEKERRLELAFEGHRWFDLKRTNRVIPVMNGFKDSKGSNIFKGKIQPYMLLWPVPQSERDMNSKLTQNAGY